MTASTHRKKSENRLNNGVLTKMPLLSPEASAIIHGHLPPPNVEQYIVGAPPGPSKHEKDAVSQGSRRVNALIQVSKRTEDAAELLFESGTNRKRRRTLRQAGMIRLKKWGADETRLTLPPITALKPSVWRCEHYPT
jgi:hypothetical protein